MVLVWLWYDFGMVLVWFWCGFGMVLELFGIVLLLCLYGLVGFSYGVGIVLV